MKKKDLISSLERQRKNFVNYFIDKGYFVEPPSDKLFYHYTNLEGLCGILNSKKIWATNAYFLNDYSELKYGIGITLEVLEKIVFEKVKERELQLFYTKFAEKLPYYLSVSNVYVMSFCEKKDLLSQWKGYTNQNGGVSIGFNISKLEPELNANVGYLFGKVIYDKDIQIDILYNILLSIKETVIHIIKNQNDIVKYFNCIAIFLTSSILTVINLFKSQHYKEEREWRLIIDYDLLKSKPKVKYRSKIFYIAPYIEIDISNKINTSVKEVCVGPYYNAKDIHTSLHFVLINEKIEDCKLSYSKIPFRI
jgi:hypothetical protein